MILRLLGWQGIAGLALSAALGLLLVLQKADARHWKKRSAGFEQLYDRQRSAFETTVASYRAAAADARAADQANANRVRAAQRAINERTDHDYQTRLAAARAAAASVASRGLRGADAEPDPSARRGASVPGLSAASGGAAETPGQDGLSPQDALTATEQAIQLDELITWVRRQAAIDNKPQRQDRH